LFEALAPPKDDVAADRTGEDLGLMSVRVLMFDTETNGLPKNKHAPYTMPEFWPAILQLSWAIYGVVEVAGMRSLRLESRKDLGLALDPAIPWDAGAAAVHGIREEDARTGGAPVLRALTEFSEALRSVDVIVAHNLAFDKAVIRAAGYRVGLRDLWPSPSQDFCSMMATRKLVNLPPHPNDPQMRPKSPRLGELYEFIFGHRYDMLGDHFHAAKSDVHCLAQCLQGLLRKGHMVCRDGCLSMAA